jgi:metallo-beta-lactamase family protein
VRLRFLGAAGTVTGSKYLLETARTRLLVDCGLYQGVKHLRLRNWSPPPFDPVSLDGVVLTHAHLDHSGYLPALVRDGYAGRIHATDATADLCRILLPDSGHIHEEDARYANRKKFSKHDPARPLYTEADALEVLPRLERVDFGRSFAVGDLTVRMARAGHILGAASVEVSHAGRRVIFSGDLGRSDDLVMRPPEPPEGADFVLVESTYGDRNHPASDGIAELAALVAKVSERGSVLLIPSFAVGRAQTMLYCLHRIFERGLAPRLPVFVDSPMATDVTALYERHGDCHKLSPEHCRDVCDVAEYTRSVEQSKALRERRGAMVIVSASGMATGGRVLHHLKSFAPDPRNVILLPGYQAPGTRGDSLARGAELVKIHGGYVRVRAEVVQLDVFSAHADQDDLLAWLGKTAARARRVFVVHGESVAADTLRRLARERLGVAAQVPEHLEVADLAQA